MRIAVLLATLVAAGAYACSSSSSPSTGDGGSSSSSGGSSGSGSGGSSGGSSGSGSGSGSSSGGGDAGPCVVATIPGLVAYYPFDGDAKDYSGNGYNATATNVTSEAGVLGQAYLFNGSNSAVTVSSGITAASLPRTFCAWISPAPGATGLGLPIILSGNLQPGGSDDQFSVAGSGSHIGGCSFAAPNALFLDHFQNACITSATATVTPGGWSFVCYETNGTQLQFYVNGTGAAVTGSVYPWAIPNIVIGGNNLGAGTTGPSFGGGIDEVSLWSAVLSPSQIASLYNGGAGCRAHP